MIIWRLPLVALMCLSITVTGCMQGGKGQGSGRILSQSTASDMAGPPEKTKLRFWSTGRHDANYIKEVIHRYNEENSDLIEVEMTVMADDFAQSLDLSFASEQSPDIFTPIDLAEMSRKGYVEPLNPYLTPEIRNRFGKQAFIEGYNVFDPYIYSLPNSGSTLRLIYNAELFKRAGITSPPKSLDELVEAASRITEIGKADGIYGFALPYKNPASALGRSAVPIAEISGISGDGYDFSTGSYDFSGFIPIISAFRTMMENGSTLPGSESLDIDPLRAQFADGKIGMYLSYSSEPSIYKYQFPAKIQWGAALPPSIDGTYKGVINQGVGATRWLSISSQSKHKEEAWKFLRYMYSDEVLIGYQEAGLGILSVEAIAAKARKPDIDGITSFFPGEYDGIWPASPQGFKPKGKEWEDEFVKFIMIGGDLDSLVEDLNARYNAALDQERAAGRVDMKAIPSFDPLHPQDVSWLSD
ncbi:extracellular solute-binding protein [Paenibacillus sp. FSL W7-1279]|uniref:ABC transporter substrate-binding protein n=1 Tax=Paenibacillus sp. FSL W7-1279 TaxID=2921697 RepID=UPI0030DCCDB2